MKTSSVPLLFALGISAGCGGSARHPASAATSQANAPASSAADANASTQPLTVYTDGGAYFVAQSAVSLQTVAGQAAILLSDSPGLATQYPNLSRFASYVMFALPSLDVGTYQVVADPNWSLTGSRALAAGTFTAQLFETDLTCAVGPNALSVNYDIPDPGVGASPAPFTLSKNADGSLQVRVDIGSGNAATDVGTVMKGTIAVPSATVPASAQGNCLVNDSATLSGAAPVLSGNVTAVWSSDFEAPNPSGPNSVYILSQDANYLKSTYPSIDSASLMLNDTGTLAPFTDPNQEGFPNALLCTADGKCTRAVSGTIDGPSNPLPAPGQHLDGSFNLVMPDGSKLTGTFHAPWYTKGPNLSF